MPTARERRLYNKIMQRVRKQYPRYSLKRRQYISRAIIYQKIRRKKK